jgi:hypothetical protein
MSAFKVGDKIRCTNGTDALRTGTVHTVLYAGPGSCQRDMVGIDTAEPEWIASRFELVEPAKPIVRTKEQVWADRTKELLDGIVATHTAGQEIPREWIEELYYNVAGA